MFDSPEIEKHWRVNQVAARTGVSRRTVIREFENDPRVKIIGEQRGTRRKRRYRTILIPHSVLEEWLGRY